MTSEEILAVRRAHLFQGAWPQGFLPSSEAREALECIERLSEVLPRDRAEADPEWKQPIPYCLVTSGDERVLCTRRKAAGSEARLHGLLSVGLGGHAHAVDRASDHRFFASALQRELREELHVPEPVLARAQLLGLINDDSTPVGRVHVGIAYWLDVGELWPSVTIRELSKLSGGFERLVGSDNLWQDPGRFESWSWILLEAWRLLRQSAGQDKSGKGIHTKGREVCDADGSQGA